MLWDQHKSWEEAEAAWGKAQATAQKAHPLKVLKNYPTMVGMTKETAKNLRWKSLKWMVQKDEGYRILKAFFKHPFRYLTNYVLSLFSRQTFKREGDLFLYGFSSIAEFEKHLQQPNTLFVLGFSYCHKPFECPSGRFTDQCVHDLNNPVCQQCFIGKCVHAAPQKDTVPLYIPTVHYISQQMLELMDKHPDKKILFLITACEMTLNMFADWGNMAALQGIGVRLDGRICNTMKAFELSEKGIKPGLTVVLDPTQQRMLDWIRLRREKY